MRNREGFGFPNNPEFYPGKPSIGIRVVVFKVNLQGAYLVGICAAPLAAEAGGTAAAEAVGAERSAFGVNVRLGELEEVEREESRDIGLRVFVGQRQATVSGSDISAEARAKLVDRAVAMARLAPEDPYAGLADPGLYAKGALPDLDLFDGSEPTPETLEARARAAEDAARSPLSA